MRVRTLGEARASRVVEGALVVRTSGPGFSDVTGAVRDWLREIEAGSGALIAVVQHTTASLVVQENADRSVRADLLTSLGRLAPERDDYRHAEEGRDDMPGHIKAMLTDVSLVLPVARGALALGTWQAVYLVEHRAGGRERTVRLHYLGS